MSASDNDLNSDIAATDEAAELVVVPNLPAATNETPANVAPDKARLLSTTVDLNPVPNASTRSHRDYAAKYSDLILPPAKPACPSMNESTIFPSALYDNWPRTLGLQRPSRTRRLSAWKNVMTALHDRYSFHNPDKNSFCPNAA